MSSVPTAAPARVALKAARSPSQTKLLPLRLDRHELAGGVGDIAIMIPLACGVATVAHLSLVTVFLCVAASYAATALVFRVPVPVQPMKAMAASIIALGLSSSVVGAAGIEIAVLLLLLAFTPAADYLARLFPKAVVRGTQLSIGLLLVKSAFTMAAKFKALPVHLSLQLGPATITAGVLVALFTLIVLFAGRGRRRLPAGLLVVGLGALGGVVLLAAGLAHAAPVPTHVSLPILHLSAQDAWIALFALVLPQVPLSLGNAVFATEDALRHYYGPAARRATPANLCLSMGLMNVGCGLLGGMALCHGSGGATAHYRLGARTAGATLCAAGLYFALAGAAAFGASPLLIPGAVLGGMLLFVGVEHCLLVADLATLDEMLCAALIAVIALAFGNLAIGFLVGWAAYMGLKRTPLARVALRWPRVTEQLAPHSATRPATARVRAR
ncbi:MAG TPA: putative sulfate/molybdate transporter [Thermoleophilia bacterium]|nr:putative sulfate/molybdate transporter [Thermoleophilia bacterium]